MHLNEFVTEVKYINVLQNRVSESHELVTLVENQVDMKQVLDWIEHLSKEGENKINQLASLMEIHPLGFEKYVIYDDESNLRIRLHFWPKNKWPLESIHDHRFNFCAKILCGSYVHEEYEILNVDNLTGNVELVKTRTSTLETGDTYFFPAGKFHRVIPTEEVTLSLIIRGKAILPYSQVIDPDKLTLRKAYGAASKFINKLNGLRTVLQEENFK